MQKGANIVGRIGLEPTEPEGTGFTIRPATNYGLPTHMRAIADSHYSFFHADIEICAPVITKISSILTPSTDANTTKLSMVGNAVPCCHL